MKLVILVGLTLASAQDVYRLHDAAREGDVDKLKALVAAGASLEAQADNEATPLHLPAMHGQTESIKALVEAGALVDAVSYTHLTLPTKRIV